MNDTRGGFIGVVIAIIVGGILFLIVAALVWDFQRFSAVYEANTPEALKAACTNKWYRSDRLQDLPVQCVQFYKVGVGEPTL